MAKTKSNITKIVAKGDKIKVDYEGRFESGEVFDSSKHGDHSHPLEFEAGSGQVIPGFDNAVIGMKIGEEKEFKINAKEAYGEHNPQLVREIPRNVLPQDQEPKPGMMLVMNAGNQQVPVKITEVTKDKIKIDLNHPLAGKNLIFKIKLVSID
jgi:peptidylprolyl isomerase